MPGRKTIAARARSEVAAHSWWMAKNLRIINKDSKLVPLMVNPEQQRFLYSLAFQAAHNMPVRAMVLKARRVGISTVTEGLFFEDCLLRPYRKAFIVARDGIKTQTIFNMTRLFNSELSTELRRKMIASNRREIQFDKPHYSHLLMQSAGDSEVGRSQEIHDLHGSEVAFWPNATQALTALMQGVANRPNTTVVLETTANGVGGAFYDRWIMAIERMRRHPGDLGGFMPLFFSWLEFAEYRMPLPKGYTLGRLDDDEQFLRSLGADDEQLYWRRRMLEDYCGGDPAIFKQEYPATWQEAFQFSGRQAIPNKILEWHQKHACEGRRVILKRDGKRVWAEKWSGSGPFWEVWDEPQEFDDYTIGGDVAEGKLSDPMDDLSDADYSTGAVLNRRQLRYDAEWHGRIDSDLFGEEMLKAALWYNMAWVSPEVNNAGWAALSKLRDYPNLYQRQGPKDEVAEERVLQQYGWRTTTANRDYLIDDYIAACRPGPVGGFDGKLVPRSERLFSEEMTFVYDKRGKRQHRPGAHDDMLFAHMIAWQLHLHCPRQVRIPFSPQKPVAGARSQAYRYVGGIDPGIPGLSEPASGVEVAG